MNADPQLPEGVRAKLRKIQALAERGHGGERETAARMLADLCAEHGVNASDLIGETKEWVRFTWKDARDRELLESCAFHVLNRNEFSLYRRFRSWEIELTKAEAIDLRACLIHYRRLWKEEEATLFTAFIGRHRIYSDKATKGGEPLDPAKLAKIMAMMRHVSGESWKKPSGKLTA